MNVTAFAVYSNSLAIYSYKIPTCFESYIVVTSLYKHVTCIIHLKPIYIQNPIGFGFYSRTPCCIQERLFGMIQGQNKHHGPHIHVVLSNFS